MFEQNTTTQELIAGREVTIDWEAQTIELQEVVRVCGIKIAALEALLAEQKMCKWPTCQSEEYQQSLAEQVKQELIGEQQIYEVKD